MWQKSTKHRNKNNEKQQNLWDQQNFHQMMIVYKTQFQGLIATNTEYKNIIFQKISHCGFCNFYD